MDDYGVESTIGALLRDLGVSPANVLRRAGLPADLFSRGPVRLAPAAYFALWVALEDESGDPDLPVRVGRTLSAEVFTPPMFAALCSPDLGVAARRLASYKQLIGPLRLDVTEGGGRLVLECRWPADPAPPDVLVITELVFWVALARMGTRQDVRPRRVGLPRPPANPRSLTEYFGVAVEVSPTPTITFADADVRRPFLTANEPMWEFFEPELRQRLSQLGREATTSDRVRAALLELLPAGQGTMPEVARSLAVSTRTLQRRLLDERTTFQAVLTSTREALAERYLADADLTADQISFLLGYSDPKSFYRAFRGWTGSTPARARDGITG